jgi:hypothetical protein
VRLNADSAFSARDAREDVLLTPLLPLPLPFAALLVLNSVFLFSSCAALGLREAASGG